MKKVEEKLSNLKRELVNLINKDTYIDRMNGQSIKISQLTPEDIVKSGIIHDYVVKLMNEEELEPDDWFDFFQDNCVNTKIREPLIENSDYIYIDKEINTAGELVSYVVGLCIQTFLNQEISNTILNNGNIQC